MLRYRTATDDDTEALAAFWNAHSGWDTLDAETYADRFMRPPVGTTRIVIGETEGGEIGSKFVFIPVPVWVDGREAMGLRPFAPVVAPDARSGIDLNPLHHPVVAMFSHARTAFRDLGDSVIYMVPDPRWRRLFKPIPQFKTASFPLLSLPLPLGDGPLALDGYRAGPLDGWDHRVDALWAAARGWMGVQLVRDSRTLPWKVGGGDYRITTVERDGDLAGLVASRHKGDQQWLVCDALAVDAEALGAALAAAVNEGHRAAGAAPEDAPITKASVLASPALGPVAEALGFRPGTGREKYTFYLVVSRLDDTLPARVVAPDRWHISPND